MRREGENLLKGGAPHGLSFPHAPRFSGFPIAGDITAGRLAMRVERGSLSLPVHGTTGVRQHDGREAR